MQRYLEETEIIDWKNPQVQELAKEHYIHDTVNREVTQGIEREINSTPTVFVTVNKKTQKIDRVLPYEVWKGFFDDNLK